MAFFRGLLLVVLLVLTTRIIAADKPPELVSILEFRQYRFALFRGYDITGYVWRRPGEAVGAYQVDRVERNQVLLIDNDHVSHALSFKAPRPPGRSDDDQRAWANSSENPMLWHPIRLPRLLEKAINHMTDEDRAVIHGWYKDYGWKAEMVINAEGLWSIAYENIYEVYRQNTLKQRWSEFRSKLTPEQLALYDEISLPRSYEYMQKRRRRLATLRTKFEASLSPELKAMYRSFSVGEPIQATSLDTATDLSSAQSVAEQPAAGK